MLATYPTFLQYNRFLHTLMEQHRHTGNTLKLVTLADEDFLTLMRRRRKELNLRYSVLSEKILESIHESKSLLSK